MIRIFMAVFVLLIAGALQAQSTYLQIGGIASFYQHQKMSLGGGADVNVQTNRNLVLGAGFAVLSFSHDNADGTYVPLFGRVGYAFLSKSLVFTLHGDAGYGLYHRRYPLLGGKSSEQGGLYASPGFSLHVNNRFSPFVDVRYSVYDFTTTFDFESTHHQNKGFTLSFGFCFLRKKVRG